MAGVLQGVYARTILVVSHRWVKPGAPDPDGVQEGAIKAFLCDNPQIEFVWYDFWSMPQAERTADEDVNFEIMLLAVNLLYLGGTVLILLDEDYMHRFWTSAEAWLATRACRPSGLMPAGDPKERCHIVVLPGSGQDLADALMAMWADKKINEACDLLRTDVHVVTNQSDKEKLIPKLMKLHKTVQGAWAAAQEDALKERCPMLELVIDQPQSTPLAIMADGELIVYDPDAPPRKLKLELSQSRIDTHTKRLTHRSMHNTQDWTTGTYTLLEYTFNEHPVWANQQGLMFLFHSRLWMLVMRVGFSSDEKRAKYIPVMRLVSQRTQTLGESGNYRPVYPHEIIGSITTVELSLPESAGNIQELTGEWRAENFEIVSDKLVSWIEIRDDDPERTGLLRLMEA